MMAIAAMTRNHVKSTGTRTESLAWKRGLQATIAWGAALLVCAAVWLALSKIASDGWRRGWGVLALFTLHALLSYVSLRGLRHAPLTWKWQYRASFLFSAGLPWLFFVARGVGFPVPELSFMQWLSVFGFAFFGALVGGLWVTAIDIGLWENNSPPPAQIAEQVRQLHSQVIGDGDPVPWAKRVFDLALAILGLFLSMPIWSASLFLIWFEDPGPVLFVKNSVARGGANFRQYKLRTMVFGAEEHTGPVLAGEGDQRVLKSGRILRKTALDELPQLINILRGEMSFVGPRPQRTVLVHSYLQDIPEYAERHRVLPGLSGLAQVAGDYYLTPRQKLRFDRLYIRYYGLGFDLLLLFLAFLITFWYRWQVGWGGRLPRGWLHSGGARSLKLKPRS